MGDWDNGGTVESGERLSGKMGHFFSLHYIIYYPKWAYQLIKVHRK